MSNYEMDQNAADFWSQGNHTDPVSNGLADMQEAGERSAELREARDNFPGANDQEESVKIAVDVNRFRDDDRADWEAFRDVRDYLNEIYPKASWREVGEHSLGWIDGIKANAMQPRGLAALREQYVRQNLAQPFHPQVRPKLKADEPPADLDEIGKRNWHLENDVKLAVRETGANKRDAEAYATTAELRQSIKEKTGLSPSEYFKKVRMIDTSARDDPGAVFDRLAIAFGAPATEAHAQQQQRLAEIVPVYHRIEERGDLPGLGTKAVDDLICDVLSSPRFVRTQDSAADLAGAYSIAVRELQRRGTEAAPDNRQSREAAERARFASRSISGSPSPGASARSTQDRPAGSYDGDLQADVRRAVRQVGARA
jgi:hypothetical protein